MGLFRNLKYFSWEFSKAKEFYFPQIFQDSKNSLYPCKKFWCIKFLLLCGGIWIMRKSFFPIFFLNGCFFSLTRERGCRLTTSSCWKLKLLGFLNFQILEEIFFFLVKLFQIKDSQPIVKRKTMLFFNLQVFEIFMDRTKKGEGCKKFIVIRVHLNKGDKKTHFCQYF